MKRSKQLGVLEGQGWQDGYRDGRNKLPYNPRRTEGAYVQQYRDAYLLAGGKVPEQGRLL